MSMRGATPRTGAAGLLIILCLTLLAGCEEEPQAPPAGDQAITELAERLQAAFSIPESSLVLFTGPVEPGTVLRENGALTRAAVELEVPGTEGTYYALLIDDEPERMFEHAVRFAWIDLDSETTGTASAGHWMTVFRPGVEPRPFNPTQCDEVLGVDCYFVEGEGGAEEADISPKEEIGARAPQHPWSPLRGRRLGSAAPSPARGIVKRALVFDGGDKKGITEGAGYFGAKNWSSIAEELAEVNAAGAAAWLGENDFTVERVSQYWGNSHPYFGSAAKLYDHIRAYGAEFASLGPPDAGCDNFFLYITAHGYEDGPGAFEIYYPDGSGNFDVALYSDVLGAFSDLPSFVQVTIQLDNCYGGKLISEHQAEIDALCGVLCALTIITSVDNEHAAWAPSMVHDSGTEDFMEGADEDHDGDGITGDIRDRFMEMESQGSWLGPMSFHCPEGGSWCSLDGPSENPPPSCEERAGTYTPEVTSVDDPGGHGPYVGDPFAGPLVITMEGSIITVTGTAPFVNVSGLMMEDCLFNALGLGTVAGYPDVQVIMVGALDEVGSMIFSYAMGTQGELPGGEPIAYLGTAMRR